MSGSVNKVLLVGYLGSEPEFKLSGDLTSLLKFIVHTPEIHKKNKKDLRHMEEHHIIMLRGLAEAAQTTLKRNQLISIEGKFRTRIFKDEQGVNRYFTEIIAEHFTITGRKEDFYLQKFSFCFHLLRNIMLLLIW